MSSYVTFLTFDNFLFILNLMERVAKTEYGLMAVRILFYFAVSAVLIWFFSDYYVSRYPVLIPNLDLLETKSLVESAIYFVLFLLIFLPIIYQLINARSEINETCESSLLFQKLLDKIARIFNAKKDIDSTLNESLESFGLDLDLDRVYLYQYNPGTRALNIINQWFAEEVTPLSKIQSLEIFEYPIFNKWISENIPVYIVDTQNISDQNTKDLLSKHNAYSILVIPITPSFDRRYLLFLESKRLRKWTKNDINFLNSITQILSGALERYENTQKIDQLDQLKIRFIEVISNQLRGPLQAMRQNVDNLVSLRLGNLTDIQQKVLGLVKETNQNITGKISNMLLMLDFQMGKIDLNKTEVDLIKLTEDAFNKFGQLCVLKDQKPVLQKPATGTYKAFVDKDKIAYAMQVLLENSSYYSHKYGEIEVRIDSTKDTYIFSVQDQGIGIPVSDQDNIFIPFYRAQNAKEMKTDSPGISLYLAKSIVEAHNGKIGFTTKESEGTYFWFTLPKE